MSNSSGELFDIALLGSRRFRPLVRGERRFPRLSGWFHRHTWGAGITDRCTVSAGTFMEAVPDGGDAYLLKTIIHDWDEETALLILRNVRAAMSPKAKLLLLEMVLPEHDSAHFGTMLDLEMLVVAGGKERTRSEYAKLLARAGFQLERVVETAGPLSIVEARTA